ncbi:hypothetical protein BB561_001388 [Smittium simulii]|uniref:SPX domain-containing protein n=1 Tax=Smittium simulii TaxID=133385 RepID=A0A2T9YUU5_9FUNG|nr:hypothetical protein BB561_001388 [Smittium simulii]
MSHFSISKTAYPEWKAHAIDYEALLNYIYARSIESEYCLRDREFFLHCLEIQIQKLNDFLSLKIYELSQILNHCESLLEILSHLKQEEKEIATYDASEINVIATGQILELIKFNQENFTALCKVVLKHNEFTGVGITSDVVELLKKFPITYYTNQQITITQRLFKTYQQLQYQNLSYISSNLNDINTTDSCERIFTGWIDPDRINIIISEISKHMEYYLDDDMTEQNFFHSDLPENAHDYLGSKKHSHLNIVSDNISFSQIFPVKYNTVYFDNNFNTYHNLVSGLKKFESVKIKWKSSLGDFKIPFAQNSKKNCFVNTENTEKIPINSSDSSSLTYNQQNSIQASSIAIIELENHQELWAVDSNIQERIHIPKNRINAYLASEYNVNTKSDKSNQTQCKNSKINCPRFLFKKIQKKIILEKQKPALKTCGSYYYFKDKTAESNIFIEITTNLQIYRVDNTERNDKNRDYFHTASFDTFTDNSEQYSKESKKFSPGIIKIRLKQNHLPSWLHNLVYGQENIYWVHGFDPYVYGVSMLLEKYTRLLPYWSFEVSHPSLTEDFEPDGTHSSCNSDNFMAENNSRLNLDIKNIKYFQGAKSHSISALLLKNKAISSFELAEDFAKLSNFKSLGKSDFTGDNIYDPNLFRLYRISSFPILSEFNSRIYRNNVRTKSQIFTDLTQNPTENSYLLNYQSYNNENNREPRNKEFNKIKTLIVFISKFSVTRPNAIAFLSPFSNKYTQITARMDTKKSSSSANSTRILKIKLTSNKNTQSLSNRESSINEFGESELSELETDEYDDSIPREHTGSNNNKNHHKLRKSSKDSTSKSRTTSNKHIIKDSSSDVYISSIESIDESQSDGGSSVIQDFMEIKKSNSRFIKNKKKPNVPKDKIYEDIVILSSGQIPNLQTPKNSKKNTATPSKESTKVTKTKAKDDNYVDSEEDFNDSGIEKITFEYNSSENSSENEFDYELKKLDSKKMTKRQLARLTNNTDDTLLELQTKFTKEEIALRRSEYIRKRKFQTMQRAEQLKNETINRLLSKQTAKSRNKLDNEDSKSVISNKDTSFDAEKIRWSCVIQPLSKTNSNNDFDENPHLNNKKQNIDTENKQDELNKNNLKKDDKKEVLSQLVYSLSIPKGTNVSDLFPSLLEFQNTKDLVNKIANKSHNCDVKECANTFKYKFYSKNSENNDSNDSNASNNDNLLFACSLEHYKILNKQAIDN